MMTLPSLNSRFFIHREQHMRILISPGRLYATAGVNHLISQGLDIRPLLSRHLRGDWGDIGDDDKLANDDAVRMHNDRILSAYAITPDIKIWILTDEGITTILLPSEY
ncbi:hypothetical protein [Lelliottia wanjuensis]|uniref:Type I restriction endonuclease subunit M n=2 Tax=Lelliottia wanjuensis TaxID=3050585 RepID=A0AAP4D0Z1_9ENTR|nr:MULTISPECIES: hypothetical protein [unclassified Lelliottia]MDK9361958.1 hypothetical protein [Lelliottia sp. V106_12]MDK9584317.1 hypothetical protein [Lelliottia sp. V86_10]